METGPKQIDWVPTLFLTITPIAAILSLAYYLYAFEFHWGVLLLFLFFYSATILSITAGYHRLWAHRAYDAKPIVKIIYALFGAASFQNSILKWAVDHRIHHRFVDDDRDPYAITKGFWYAHVLWMIYKEPERVPKNSYSRDLLSDKIVMWQHNHYLLISIVMGFGVPTLLGGWLCGSYFGGFAIGALLRIVVVHHGTFFINSLCHYWGSQKYSDRHTARDSLVLAFFTFGEGYHNYHHEFANDYRNGIRWYHWDPTKWAIQIKSKLGVVDNLKRTSEELILERKMAMIEKKLEIEAALAQNESLQNLKRNIQLAQDKVSAFRIEIQELKKQKSRVARARIRILQKEMRRSKKELSLAFRLWECQLKGYVSENSYA